MSLRYALKELVRRQVLRGRMRATLQARAEAARDACAMDLAALQRFVARLRESVVGPTYRGKGAPDMARIRAAGLDSLSEELTAATSPPSDAAVRIARHLAALDPADVQSYRAYAAAYALRHVDGLGRLREHVTRKVVLHVSCVPRVERAQASIASFERLSDREVSHVIAIGGSAGSLVGYDPTTAQLNVPADDTYEQLPAKVFAALSVLGMTGKVQCVLKVDDDHRLGDARHLARLLERVARDDDLAVNGTVYRMSEFGQHHRAWHYGKSQDPTVDSTPFTGLAPTSWVTGQDGYAVTRSVLTMATSALVYQHDYVETGIYEDLVLANLVLLHGGTLSDQRMASCLSMVSAY
jgi:hypothetical protein